MTKRLLLGRAEKRTTLSVHPAHKKEILYVSIDKQDQSVKHDYIINHFFLN